MTDRTMEALKEIVEITNDLSTSNAGKILQIGTIARAALTPSPAQEVRADGGCLYCNADQGESHRPDCTKGWTEDDFNTLAAEQNEVRVAKPVPPQEGGIAEVEGLDPTKIAESHFTRNVPGFLDGLEPQERSNAVAETAAMVVQVYRMLLGAGYEVIPAVRGANELTEWLIVRANNTDHSPYKIKLRQAAAELSRLYALVKAQKEALERSKPYTPPAPTEFQELLLEAIEDWKAPYEIAAAINYKGKREDLNRELMTMVTLGLARYGELNNTFRRARALSDPE